jgi:hypothetical protein
LSSRCPCSSRRLTPMAHARSSRVYAAPTDVVAKAIDVANARDGDPAITWNSARTAGREDSSDLVFDITLTPVAESKTRLTIEVTGVKRRHAVFCRVLGKPALALTLKWLQRDVKRQVDLG